MRRGCLRGFPGHGAGSLLGGHQLCMGFAWVAFMCTLRADCVPATSSPARVRACRGRLSSYLTNTIHSPRDRRASRSYELVAAASGRCDAYVNVSLSSARSCERPTVCDIEFRICYRSCLRQQHDVRVGPLRIDTRRRHPRRGNDPRASRDSGAYGRCGLIHAPDAAFAYTLCVVSAYSPRSPARLNLKHQKQYQ